MFTNFLYDVTMPDVALKSDAGNRPPVVTTLNHEAERRDFVAYIQDHVGRSHVDVAIVEQKRLSYYWDALDKRLTRGGPVEKGGTPKDRPSIFSYFVPNAMRDYKPADHYKSGDLNNIFENVAKQTRSIVLAEVLVCPASMRVSPDLDAMKTLLRGSMESTSLESQPQDGLVYSFGFLEIRHQDHTAAHPWDVDQSSIAIPVLYLNDGMMDKIAPYNSAPLLKHLQTVITLCNHDMMHNMVNTISRGDISKMAEAHFKPELKHFMEDKTGQHNPDDILGFESALVIGHAHTWQDLKETESGQKMQQAVEGFYNELERITQGMTHDSSMDIAARHQIADYFAMSIPYALARMIPLNDPLMERALERAQDIDPAPDLVLAQQTHIEHLRADRKTKQTLDNYKAAGVPLVPDQDDTPSYAGIKKLQLVRIMPDTTILLSPARKGSTEYKAHARADEMDRDIVNIILRHSANTPI